MAKKPIDDGFKRNLFILGGVIGGMFLLIGGIVAFSGNKPAEIAPSSLGRVVPASGTVNTELTPAQKEQLERVQLSEAEAAKRAGRTYIPDVMLGQSESIEKALEEARREVDSLPAPGPGGSNLMSYQQNIENNVGKPNTTRRQQNANVNAAFLKQAELIMASLAQPAMMQTVNIMDTAKEEPAAVVNGTSQDGIPEFPDAGKKGAEIIGGDEIVAARLTTPVDTDKTRFVMAEISGGRLDGAQLRGEVVTMAMSGDIEDIGIRFSSMRWRDRQYRIDAIALNESTATDALDGKVDRHLFTRYAMPILMAGLSGVSTYFTARGTPGRSVATSVATGDTLVVNEDRASRDDAINQGIGDVTNKAVQTGERFVSRMATRPNSVRLPASTPIGIIFNAPVHAGDS